MTLGHVTRLVTSFGSQWGRVRPQGEERELFFNPGSFIRSADFAEVREGQEVSFDEESDRANGLRAVNMVLSGGRQTPKAGASLGDRSG
jgi:cold shock CspA family protein